MGRWTKKNKKIAIFSGIFLFAIIGVGLLVYFDPASILGGDDEEPTPTLSSFKTIDYMSREDVSNFCELSIWTPKSSSTFDEEEDYYTMSKFEETKSSMDADDISIDLSLYICAWVEVDPDGEEVFENDFYFLAGVNDDYPILVYDLTTDVNFNLLDKDTLAVVDLSTGNEILTGEYLIPMDCPPNTQTASELHVGTNWETEQSDFDDMTANEKAFYYDEANWKCQAPTYDPAEDLEKDYDDDLERLTEAFALKFDFNTTISTVDGNSAQVNVSVGSEFPVEVVISGDLIYFIFYETIDFEDGAYTLYFDMDIYAKGTTTIGLDDIDSVRVEVPRDDDSLGTVTKLSDIGA